MVNKKGLFFWLEMVILVIIFVIIFVNLPQSSDNFLGSKDAEDLENFGFNTLRNLDNGGILDEFTDDTDFANSNFTELSVYIRNSFPSTIITNLEYFDGTTCFSESGSALSSCGNFTKPADTVRTDYTMTTLAEPVTIQLYLRRIF